MSGGVDSSVASHLLISDGYTPIGVTFIMHNFTPNTAHAAEAAKSVADVIGMPHYTVSVCDRFKSNVVADFTREYDEGRTPNPCVVCNRTVKFPCLMDFADAHACGKAATGHYARIEKCGDRYVIKKAADESKDQTYMLWGLSQEILSRLILPLGEYTKPEIREIAETAHLPSAKSKDSQDICFIPDGDYVGFLIKQGHSPIPGDYTDESGAVIGRHKGQQCYTIGQRKGLGISLGKHAFVLAKDAQSNKVTLGDEDALYKKTVVARGVNLIACDSLEKPERLSAKVRYGKTAAPATVWQSGENEVTAEFDEPMRAPAPGQSLVVYDGDTVVLGGIII